MRYQEGHKARTHQRILGAARRVLRREGVRGASVERVMRRAGLTVGGFYAHFASKDSMVAEALRSFMRESGAAWLAGLEPLRGRAWAEPFLARYLDERKRDDLETGCLLPTVLSELTQGGAEVQRVAVEELEDLVSKMSVQLGDGAGASARQRAIALFVLSVGGLAVARVARRTGLSGEVLEACRAFAGDALTGAQGPAPGPHERAAAPRQHAGAR